MQYTIYVQVKRLEPWSILTSWFTKKKIGKLSKFGEYELSVHILYKKAQTQIMTYVFKMFVSIISLYNIFKKR